VASSARKSCIARVTGSTSGVVALSASSHGPSGYSSTAGNVGDSISWPNVTGFHVGSSPLGPRFGGVPGAPKTHSADRMIMNANRLVAVIR
jgi:hypothetical protein